MLKLIVIFAQLATAPTPVYRATPIPHWHCPAGYFVPDPNIRPPLLASCVELNASTEKVVRFMGFNPGNQEQARWWFSQKIGKDGLLKVDYPFERRPSCTITGDELYHIRFLQDTKVYSVIKGRPGQVLSFACSLNISKEPA